jgi:hypothetical protein
LYPLDFRKWLAPQHAKAEERINWGFRLALVTLEQMTQTLAWAVENPPQQLQVFEPPQIKLGESLAANRQPTAAAF